MKYWYYFLILLFHTPFALYAQNVYPHISELNGMEDYNGITNLLYRISSSQVDSFNSNYSNDIYLLNTVNHIDSLFQIDGSYYNIYLEGGWRIVNSFDFWEKNPRKFIVCGSSGGVDGSAFVERFDGISGLFQFWTNDGDFIRISHQNDSLVYCTIDSRFLFKSTTGGASWDTAGYLNAFSLSPFNDQVLFSTENGILNKTTDGGLNKQVVDTISANGYRTDFLFYDKDSNYIYRTGFYYNQGSVYKFLVSDKSGDAYSWQEKYSSPLPLYVSVDYTIAGSVYLAAGKIIYSSTDFGYTFSPLRTLDRNITGIYKKPGFSKLYASTDNAIYEIDGSAISIIKQIPIDKEIFRFDPLDIGNKWVYHISSPTLYNLDKEVVKDTLLANNKLFKQIRMIYSDSLSKNISFTYERIDSLTGDVYSWGADSTEYIIDNLNHNPGDTIFASRYFRTGSTFFDSLKTVSLLGKQFETRVYSTGDPFIGYDYYLSKNMGVSHIRHNAEVALIITTLKGAVIKGIVYGDTSTVVGITDKNPVRLNKFTLSQNYPNPFNPSTKIRYSIAYRGNVTLKIYDIIGKEISVLVNSIKEPGNYEINFNASGFASGIYFYELRSAGNMLTKKMILIK